MTGKKNQFDPSEMYKQWLDNMSNAQGKFHEHESISA